MMLHKLRRAMVRPGRDRRSGVVEVDETYWGAEEPGLIGRLTENKVLVAVAVEEDPTLCPNTWRRYCPRSFWRYELPRGASDRRSTSRRMSAVHLFRFRDQRPHVEQVLSHKPKLIYGGAVPAQAELQIVVQGVLDRGEPEKPLGLEIRGHVQKFAANLRWAGQVELVQPVVAAKRIG